MTPDVCNVTRLDHLVMSTATAARRLTVTEIAQLAKVGVSAVSNWRKRHGDFPAPAESTPSGDLFDLGEVVAWLQRNGREVDLPRGTPLPDVEAEHALWSVATVLRNDGLSVEEVVLVCLQLLVLHQFTGGLPGGDRRRPGFAGWAHLRQVPPSDMRQHYEELVQGLVPEVRDQLDEAMELPRGISGRSLYEVVHHLERLPAPESGGWGALAGRLLRRAHHALAVRAGELATPESLTTLMVELLAPITGTVYDPTAGHAMVLAAAAQARHGHDLELVGQEVSERARQIGVLHLALQDVPFALMSGDTLRDDRFRERRADRVILEAPLGQRLQAPDSYFDERWRYGTTTSAEWMWAQHLLFHLAEQGVGVMTMPVGALTRDGRDARIRRGLIESDCLDAVIELPPGLVFGVNVALALLVFARDRRSRAGQVLFVDARQLGLVRRGRANELTPNDVARLVGVVEAWRQGRFQDEPRFAATASLAAVVAPEPGTGVEAVLAPKRFVRYTAAAEEGDHQAAVVRVGTALDDAGRALTSVGGLGERVRGAVGALQPTPDAEWPLVKLRDLLVDRPQNGSRQDPDGPETARPWIATRLVSGGAGRIVAPPSEQTRGRVKGRLARRGDVLLASRGIEPGSPVGCATIAVDGEFAFAESLMLLSPDPARVHSDYLRLALTAQAGRTALAAVTTGSVIANLRSDALEEVAIALPPLDIQHQLVAAVRTLEDAAGQLATALATSRALLDTVRDEIAVGHYGVVREPPARAARATRRRTPPSADTPAAPTA
jgi:type I restriction enzyme M protein